MSDLSYLQILKQFEELYPNASGEVLAAAARCETMMTQEPAVSVATTAPVANVVDMWSHAAARRARI